MVLDNLMLVYIAVFLAGLLLVEGLYYMMRSGGEGARAVNRRLRMQQRTEDGREVLSALRKEQRDLKGPFGYFNRLLMQSGTTAPLSRLFVWMIVAGFVTFVLMAAASPFPTLMSLVIGILAGAGLPVLWLQMKIRKRAQRFAEQLPDALDTIARSLRAGHPFSSALTLASSDMSDPIGTELGIVVDEMTYGLDLHTALDNLRGRVRLPDLDYMVVAITIQHETGGNLAEVLGNLSRVMRDRFRMFLKVRALSAEGRLSAWIISVLPFIVAFFIHLMNPSYFGKYMDVPLFQYLMLGGFTGILLGAFTMFRMVRFRV
jgi:tight adherence protein B